MVCKFNVYNNNPQRQHTTMYEQNEPQQETSLFDDEIFQYEEASSTKRFVNWLIDNLFMRYVLSYATGYLVAHLLVAIAPDFLYQVVYEEDRFTTFLFLYMVGMLNYFLYYTLCEKAFKGYTLGKLISGSRAIRTDGSELTLKDAVLRSLSRLVPFEAFSALAGRPWHDTWTKTTVINVRR